MKPISLLLVDDDRHLLDSMASWLRVQGYDVQEATGVSTAIERLEEADFDLVISDVRLQDGDGFQVLAHCRENRPGLDVILLTGYGTVDTGIDALREGAFDLLTKPLNWPLAEPRPNAKSLKRTKTSRPNWTFASEWRTSSATTIVC